MAGKQQKRIKRDHVQVDKRRREVMKMLVNGSTWEEIRSTISEQYGISRANVQKDMAKVKKKLYEYRDLIMHRVVNLHIIRYEELYKIFKMMDRDDLALSALNYKESLLGFHKPNTSVQVDNTMIEEEIEESKYDINKLDEGKQKRLKELAKKCDRRNNK